jgi:hypothetical protein
MARNARRVDQVEDEAVQLLARLLGTLQDPSTIRLAQASVPQRDIGNLAGVDMGRVNQIAKALKRSRQEANEAGAV